jgi:uncharacterized membrane protein YdjX (TVP38/TMEM64 family)
MDAFPIGNGGDVTTKGLTAGTVPLSVQRATVRQLFGLGIVAAIAVTAAFLVPPAAFLARTEGLLARPALFAVVIGLLYLARPLLAWPISALSILLGYLFGPVVIPVALAGAVVTTLPAYLFARYIGHDTGLLARVGDVGEVVRGTTGDLRGIIAVRLAPLPTDPVSYAAGLAGVPIRPYVAGTALGEAPWVGAAVLFGASMGQLVTAGLSASPLLLVTTVSLALLFALSRPVYNRLAQRTAV